MTKQEIIEEMERIDAEAELMTKELEDHLYILNERFMELEGLLEMGHFEEGE